MLSAGIYNWAEQNSNGFTALVNYRLRALDEKVKDLIEAYQLSVLYKDICTHRQDNVCSENLAILLEASRTSLDASNLTLYRGLALENLPVVGDVHEETSLSGWSLYPSVALNLAMVQTGAHFVIMEERCGFDEPALYIDETEQELIRPPLRKHIRSISGGQEQVHGMMKSIWVVSLG